MISSRERRIAWIAGVAIGAFALDSLIVSPLLDRQASAQSRVDNATLQLAKADGIFQNKLKAQKVWNEMAGESVQASPPQAESQLLSAARDWAQSSGLSLTSLKQERMEREQGFGKMTVRASATGDMQALGRFLYEIQSADIPVRVVDITVNSRREGTDDLTVQIGLATIYQAPAEPDPRGSRREARP